MRELLTPLVAQLTAAKRPSADEVARLWRKLVGAQAARHSRPIGLQHGELKVAVETSVWLWNLSLQRQRLLQELQAALGADMVTRIQLRLTTS